ncbi:complement factor H-like isoform X3 [Pantherophis guttatus]|uniref:Complement factor H-like isoform X3 n=1 Tax=Pantherophis guttatus TaxID=94885 RepID=A0ABM3ZD99_PANGU|nr:complement factor H-like isoform X3 [Pantherophis guttatus]
MDLPLCISERGKNCSGPPRTENGDIITLSKKQYRSGSSVEFRCQTYYAMEGQNRSFCNNGTWTKVPNCLEITCNSPRISNGTFRPQRTIYHDGDLIRIQCDSGFTFDPDNGEKVVECTKNGWSPPPKCIRKGCDYIRIENGRMAEHFERYKPFPIREGQSIQFYCSEGFLPKDKQTWQTAKCISSRYDPEPKCFKMCDPSKRFYYGHIIYQYWSNYIEGDNVTFDCNMGYSPANQQSSITCTKKGWSPAPRCKLFRPAVEHTCTKISLSHGNFGSQQQSFQINAKAKYICHDGYTTSKGETEAETQCLTEGWSPEPECINKPKQMNNRTHTTPFEPEDEYPGAVSQTMLTGGPQGESLLCGSTYYLE